MAGDDSREIVTTGIEALNDHNPQWNACFSLKDRDATTPLIFVAADADFSNEDDAIGYACTTATSGMRWLDLLGPGGAVRGRLRVQISNIAVDRLADISTTSRLGWSTIESAKSLGRLGSAAHAVVSCPYHSTPVSCQCWSDGAPDTAVAAAAAAAAATAGGAVAAGPPGKNCGGGGGGALAPHGGVLLPAAGPGAGAGVHACGAGCCDS